MVRRRYPISFGRHPFTRHIGWWPCSPKPSKGTLCEIEVSGTLSDDPTEAELRHLVAFLPEIYQDVIELLAKVD